MSYLTIVNSVLRKLREDEVSTVSENSYSTLIGDFVNQVKEEVEDSTNWNALRSTTQVTTVSGTSQYVLTSAGTRSKIVDVWNDTEDAWMYERSSKYLNSVLNTTPLTSSSPMFYGVNGVDSSGDIQVDLWPVPNAVETINFNLVSPEAELSGSSDTTNLSERVLMLGAWAMAISERGEDGGVSYDEAQQRFMKALGDAIAIDASYHSNEFIMEVI